MGMEAQSEDISLRRFYKYVYQGDWKKTKAWMRNPAEDNFEGIELRILQPDASFRWVLVHTARVLDAMGQPSRLIGVMVDIHTRKIVGSVRCV